MPRTACWRSTCCAPATRRRSCRTRPCIHSHSYTSAQQLRRSFDEWRGLLEVYGWREPASPRHLLSRLRGSLAQADGALAARHVHGSARVAALAGVAAHQLASLAGALLGSRADRLPARVRGRLSLERRAGFAPLDLAGGRETPVESAARRARRGRARDERAEPARGPPTGTVLGSAPADLPDLHALRAAHDPVPPDHVPAALHAAAAADAPAHARARPGGAPGAELVRAARAAGRRRDPELSRRRARARARAQHRARPCARAWRA